ncbi:hypothetical protein DFH08DRAFT_341008 [Mycena albidolilacea]|uniref:Uncharacterized protein n=1 Tax=Mycena albidolilacea TaxID=1033008 RepID=A0AAD7EI06_9AGAR|nr:hypothetical protein DFH08DRAFT_341008 [Mycena albidolilacea]
MRWRRKAGVLGSCVSRRWRQDLWLWVVERGAHTMSTLGISRNGYILFQLIFRYTCFLAFHSFTFIHTLSFPVWPERAWQATRHFGFACPFYTAQAHRQNTRVIQQAPLPGGLQGAITDRPSDSTRGTTQTPLGARATPDVLARDMSRSFTAC